MTRRPFLPSDAPSEKAVLARVRLLLHSVGCTTYSTVQTRRSRQAIGLPDLYALHQRLGGFWIETKRPGGKQTPGQVAFQHACQRAGVDYVCGGMPEVIAYLERRGVLVPRVACLGPFTAQHSPAARGSSTPGPTISPKRPP